MIIGYDLGSVNSQISFYCAESRKVETVSAVAGTRMYDIPTVLCKKYGTNQWLYAKEALQAAANGEGVLVDGLLEMALDGETVQIDAEPYDPIVLLTLFFRKSLNLLSGWGGIDRVGAILITAERMDERMKEILGQVIAGAGIKARHVAFQDYEESFYQYMLHQQEELREFAAVMMQHKGGQIRAYRMDMNHKTTPKSAVIRCTEYPFCGMEEDLSKSAAKWDLALEEIAKTVCAETRVSSVYLIGETFSREWMKASLKYLCQGRRVFLGNNLFSQGACLGMMERLKPSSIGQNCVLLGTDKLKANVGIRLGRRGEDSYLAVLNAGKNWKDSAGVCEFYVREDNFFELVVTPLNAKPGKIARMMLEGLPKGNARIRLRLEMIGESLMEVSAEDLGFGEFREASHRVWTEQLSLYE